MKIGSNEYKLIKLDTNILRETVLNNNKYAQRLLEKFFLDKDCEVNEDKYALCFSIYNVFELRPYEDIFNTFIDFFSKIPALMFYPYKLILAKEYEAYSNKNKFIIDNKIANVFSSIEKNPSYDFEYFINKMFNTNELATVINIGIRELPSIADEWMKQRKITKSLLTKKGISLDTINDKYYKTVEKETIIKDLHNNGISINKDTDYKYFPAARIMEYSQFNRVHMTKKEIKANDVVDVQLSAITPYVDAVITENFQANVYKKAKNFIQELENLEVYTLADL